jgi:hypothetical protein
VADVPEGVDEADARVSCVSRGGGGFAGEAYLTYYESAPRKAMEVAARDLTKLQAMGFVTDTHKCEEKIPLGEPCPSLLTYRFYGSVPPFMLRINHERGVQRFSLQSRPLEARVG